MEGILIAWLAGEGIVTWRWFKQGAPPPPGALLAVSGFFALLAVLAVHPPARGVATALGAGIDIAALLQILPGTKAPAKAHGWPPAKITDPTQLLPGTGGVHPQGNPANTPAAVGGANAANGAPPGTPANPGIPPTGPGTIFPPGSQSLLWRRSGGRCPTARGRRTASRLPLRRLRRRA
jgi:hypothetical protein